MVYYSEFEFESTNCFAPLIFQKKDLHQSINFTLERLIILLLLLFDVSALLKFQVPEKMQRSKIAGKM